MFLRTARVGFFLLSVACWSSAGCNSSNSGASFDGEYEIINLEDRDLIDLDMIADAGLDTDADRVMDINSDSNPDTGNDTDIDVGVVFYIAPDGNDRNSGTSIDFPFRTLEPALRQIHGGETIYMRGGVYYLTKTIRIDSGHGSSLRRTKLFSYKDEVPILDGSRFEVFDPDDVDNSIIRMTASYWHIRGLILQKAPTSFGLQLLSSNSNTPEGNIFENLRLYANHGTGLTISGGVTNNLIINCDSYENFDSQTDGENADGFAAKFDIGTGNEFRGCRAWANSDDGYDLWQANNQVLLRDCWAYENGYDIWGHGPSFTGNGNGFKLGQAGGAHLLERCVTWKNRVRGFDVNGNTTGVTLHNCTAFNSGVNFAFNWDVGNHKLRNCLSHQGSISTHELVDVQYNSWTLAVTVSESDFQSLEDMLAKGLRTPDGTLPESPFLRLETDSDLIDKGLDVGLAFLGLAPDLGAFECQ